MELFEKNISALKCKYSDIAKKISQFDIEELQEKVAVVSAKDGAWIPQVKCKDRMWNLNSRISPERAAEVYAGRYTARAYKVFFVFGFAEGRHVRRILQNCDVTNRMIICVPDIDVFAMVCLYFDIAELLMDERVSFYFPEGKIGITEILEEAVEYSNIKLLEFCILPGYDVLHTKTCNDYIESIINKIEHELVLKGTRLGFNRMIPQHMLFHMKNLIYQRNMEQLRQALQQQNLEKIPAIIVSAGPSLDKNVNELRRAQGRAFIMVVDAALRTVLKAGVKPDIICTIDPESPDRFFEKLDLTGMVWSCGRLTRPWVLENYGDKVFYQGSFPKEWKEEVSGELGYRFPDLPVGGSVTADAFVIAEYLGFKRMILVGQDMAFTNGISHTEGIEGAFGDNDEYIQSRLRVQVEGIDGTMLETDFQMWSYKKWFEKYLTTRKKKLTVIDATEGGAKIEGTIIQTLHETIQTECGEELAIYEIEQKIPPAFTKEQQERLLGKLRDMNRRVDTFRMEIESLIDRQENILQIMGREDATQQEWLGELRYVMKRNEEVMRDALLELLGSYIQEEEYEVGDMIYTEENLSLEQILEKSIFLYKGYIKATELFKEDMEEFIITG